MSDLYFPIRYSQVCPVALSKELPKKYDIREVTDCKLHHSGMNDTYKVTTENSVYYLRITIADVYTCIDYEQEASIIKALYEKGLSVVSPIQCKDGKLVWNIRAPEGNKYAILFSEAISKPSGDNIKQTHNFGRELAKIHTTADELCFDVSRKEIDLYQLVEEPLSRIKPFLKHRTDDIEFLIDASSRLGQHINDKLPKEKPFYGFCHGDIHQSNVSFNGDIPVIFDFDCMGYGWRAHDISVYLWNNSLSDENFINNDLWKAFLDGYNSIRLLSEDELLIFAAFSALRSLWVMGVHADLIKHKTQSSFYNDNYFNFFIGNFKLWYKRFFVS